MTLPTEQLLPWYDAHPVLAFFVMLTSTIGIMLVYASAFDGHLWWVRLKEYIFAAYREVYNDTSDN